MDNAKEIEAEAIRTLREIHTNESVKKSIRLRAAGLLLNKTTATPKSVDVSVRIKTTIQYTSPQEKAGSVIKEAKEARAFPTPKVVDAIVESAINEALDGREDNTISATGTELKTE